MGKKHEFVGAPVEIGSDVFTKLCMPVVREAHRKARATPQQMGQLYAGFLGAAMGSMVADFGHAQGCTKVSPGCDHCYAEARQDKRLHVVSWGAGQERKRTSPHNWRTPLAWNRKHAEFFAVHGRRQRVFCASLADVFDNEVPDQWRHDLFSLIVDTPNLDWLLLTKRIGNVLKLVDRRVFEELPNIWLGATVVNQEEADRDIPKLLAVPAQARFLSMEPLLGPVEFSNVSRRADAVSRLGRKALSGINWVIVGGESGHAARPMHPDWARSLRDQCAAAGVPFLFKQHGEWVPMMGHVEGVPVHGPKFTHPDGTIMGRAGKKAAGRLLDGRTHDEFPEVRHG